MGFFSRKKGKEEEKKIVQPTLSDMEDVFKLAKEAKSKKEDLVPLPEIEESDDKKNFDPSVMTNMIDKNVMTNQTVMTENTSPSVMTNMTMTGKKKEDAKKDEKMGSVVMTDMTMNTDIAVGTVGIEHTNPTEKSHRNSKKSNTQKKSITWIKISRRIRPDLWEMVKRAAYWNRKTDQYIMNKALEEYFKGVTLQPIPEEENHEE